MKPMEMDTNDIEKYTAELNKCSVGIEDIANSNNSNFECLNNSGLFNRGFSNINNRIQGLSKKITSLGNVVSKEKEEMFVNENRLSNLAEAIEVPQDFVVNYNNTIFNNENVILEKRDGQAIKVDSQINQEELDFQSSLAFNKKLSNIYSNERDKDIIDNESLYNINKEDLLDFSSNINLNKSEYNDNYDINKTKLGNISNDELQNNVEFKNIEDIDNIKLYNIYNNNYPNEINVPYELVKEEEKDE